MHWSPKSAKFGWNSIPPVLTYPQKRASRKHSVWPMVAEEREDWPVINHETV
jgi:hypothetical protein